MPKYDRLSPHERKSVRGDLLARKMLLIIDQMEAHIQWLERQLNCPEHGHLCIDGRCDIRDGVSVNTKKG